jgi:GT2 family glycosyltransferase
MHDLSKSVFVVILSYNHLDDLKTTIKSFKSQDYPAISMVISDNASNEPIEQWLRNDFPDIIFLQNIQNLGWAGGNNTGINYALNKSADYIILANNDIYIEDNSLISELVSDLERLRAKNVFLMGASINFYPQKEKTHNDGWILYPKEEKKGFPFNSNRSGLSDNLCDPYVYVDSPDGCFFMADSRVYRETGLLNEDFFMYADEIEFALRAWSKGFRSAVNTKLKVYHKVGTSSIPQSPFSMYYRYRNLIYLIKKNPRKIYFQMIYFRDLIKSTVKLLSIKRMSYNSKTRILSAIYKGMFDGYMNRMGYRFRN